MSFKKGDKVEIIEQPTGFFINVVGKTGTLWEQPPNGGPYWYLQGGDVPSHLIFHERRLKLIPQPSPLVNYANEEPTYEHEGEPPLDRAKRLLGEARELYKEARDQPISDIKGWQKAISYFDRGDTKITDALSVLENMKNHEANANAKHLLERGLVHLEFHRQSIRDVNLGAVKMERAIAALEPDAGPSQLDETMKAIKRSKHEL
jgi:hypothetical protein